MYPVIRPRKWMLFLLLVSTAFACNQKKERSLFELKTSDQTGLHFKNKLTVTAEFNMFTYMYFFNGAGVGAGDFNNDGKTDLFFCSNQGQNTLYLNQGKLKFMDVTKLAAIPSKGGWSTGVSVVDINNDGLLDLYICKVGDFETLRAKNQLLLCKGIFNGVPRYEEAASKYGLDFSGFSTQAAFLDFDLDGDLDMFLLNHSVHNNGTFAERKHFLGTYNQLSGDRFYRNDQGIFEDITRLIGINSSAIGYGLGIAVADINLDGYPDIYVGNDFHENDYLYINQRNGTFKEESERSLMHTSQFSMGVDIADINNDALPEIISMDMLPEDNYILKRSLGEDEYNLFTMKTGYGYSYQYTRNNLQFNRGNGHFSETGLYAGIAATDWSWAALWVDFDNDGWKDLFVSNGIPRRLNDIDYVNYISNSEVQSMIKEKKLGEQEMSVIDKFPQIKLSNKFFLNSKDLRFDDIGGKVKNDKLTFSNGAVYADFDNDGDIDLVVNNIDDEAMVYANTSNDKGDQNYIDIKLNGPLFNKNAIGAMAVVYDSSGQIRTYEKTPVHGFQSSMEIPIHIGWQQSRIDSILLVWPDQTYSKISVGKDQHFLEVSYNQRLPYFDHKARFSKNYSALNGMADITVQTDLFFRHRENQYNQFDREPLIPRMTSQDGPAIAVADINGDGTDDIFLGNARGYQAVVFQQTRSGKFIKTAQPELEKDSAYEDTDAVWADVNNDKFPDLLVASGGDEFYGNDPMMEPRVYLNDGKGKLQRKVDALKGIYMTASCITAADFNKDGFVDIFLGGRSEPFLYGKYPASYLLLNDGSGSFRNVTNELAPAMANVGLTRDARSIDFDQDGDQDLLLALEWGPILLFEQGKGRFVKRQISNQTGWWNFVLPLDLDLDGDLDIIAGNLGLNSRLKASGSEPVKIYLNDFDGNGKQEQLLTYYLNGKQIPFANKAELEKQIPLLKKNFLYADQFAKAELSELFTEEKLTSSQTLEANCFSNAAFINEGNGRFEMKPLPWQTQLSSLYDALPIDYNNDALPDLLLFGNYYPNNIQMGRNDADYGNVLINAGKGNFLYSIVPGLYIKNQVRKIHRLKISGSSRQSYVLGRNDDSTLIIQYNR